MKYVKYNEEGVQKQNIITLCTILHTLHILYTEDNAEDTQMYYKL